MEVRENPRNLPLAQVTYDSLKFKQQQWIDYSALDFLIIDQETTALKQLTIAECAQKIDVNPDTLYEWRKIIPNFWELVAERRTKLGSQSRLAKVHHTWYLKAVGGSWPHMEAYLRNFDPAYKEPKQKHELDIGDQLADALNIARERKRQLESTPEAEVIDVQPDA